MRAPSPDALERVGLSRREVPLANPGSLDSADSARDDTKKDFAQDHTEEETD